MLRTPNPLLPQTGAGLTVPRRVGVRLAWAAALLCLGTAWAGPAQAQLIIGKDTTISEGFRAERGLVVEAGATLAFDPHRSVTVESVGNVVVYGTLRIAPALPDVRHTLRILGADEAAFVGGHVHGPLETDRGVWVLGGGAARRPRHAEDAVGAAPYGRGGVAPRRRHPHRAAHAGRV